MENRINNAPLIILIDLNYFQISYFEMFQQRECYNDGTFQLRKYRVNEMLFYQTLYLNSIV